MPRVSASRATVGATYKSLTKSQSEAIYRQAANVFPVPQGAEMKSISREARCIIMVQCKFFPRSPATLEVRIQKGEGFNGLNSSIEYGVPRSAFPASRGSAVVRMLRLAYCFLDWPPYPLADDVDRLPFRWPQNIGMLLPEHGAALLRALCNGRANYRARAGLF